MTMLIGRTFAVAMAFCSAIPVFAADPPSAEEVIDRYIEAIGGREALSEVKTVELTGTYSMPALGIEADLTIRQSPPNYRAVVDITAFGMTVEEGVSGGVAWTLNPAEGNQIFKGAERDARLMQGEVEPMLHWKKYYAKAETTGEVEVDGKPAYRVWFTREEGAPETICFDKASGLMVQQETMQNGSPVTSWISNYKKVGAITMPHTITTETQGIEIIIDMKTIELNVELPEDTFALPDAIKALQ